LQNNLALKMNIKNNKGSKLIAVYFVLILIASFYQDFPLVNQVGELARTPIVLFIPVFLIVEIISLARNGSANITKMQKYFLCYLLYLILISGIYLLILLLKGNYFVLGDNILTKDLKVLSYYILIFLYMRHVYKVLSILNKKQVIFAFIFVLIFFFGVMVIEYLTLPNAFMSLHSSDSPYWRVRLLTVESSYSGTIVIVLSGIVLQLSKEIKNKFIRVLTIFCASAFVFLYVILTSSKGFIITFFITLLLLVILNMNLTRKKNLVVFLLVMIFGLMLIIFNQDRLISSFSNDVDSYSSTATRIGTIIISIICFFYNPFGVGGTYIYYFLEYLSTGINYLNHFFVEMFSLNINSIELLSYLKSDRGVAVKSGFFQLLMIGGLGSVLYFFFLFKRIIGITRDKYILTFITLFILVAVLGYISFEVKYELWFYFIFVEIFYTKAQEQE
jgi:hypothetical protein